MALASMRKPLDPRAVNQRTRWSLVDVVILTAEGVEVPSCKMVCVIFVAA